VQDAKDKLIKHAAQALNLVCRETGTPLTVGEVKFISVTMIQLIVHLHPELKEEKQFDITRN